MHDPALLQRAAADGRTKSTVLDLYGRALGEPKKAGQICSLGLRKARYLHSRERRLAADGLYGLFRDHRLLTAWVGEDLERHWLGWLVRAGVPDTFGLGPVPELPFAVRMGVHDDVVPHIPRPETFLHASNARAPIVIRAQRPRTALQKHLAAEGIPTRAHPLAPDALIVEKRANLVGSPAYQRGHFVVQDAGSQLIAELVAPSDFVIDLCAGAGGKSLHLAHLGAQVLACDVRAHALKELEKRARQSAPRIRTHLLGDLPAQTADRVLVDAPCTGSGTLRRSPHHRLWLSDAEIQESAATQRQILDGAATLVRPGGRLIYATCSVFRAENEAIVEAFLAEHPAFSLLPASTVVGEPRAAEIGDGTFLKVAPDTHDTDGFFGAVLTRT